MVRDAQREEKNLWMNLMFTSSFVCFLITPWNGCITDMFKSFLAINEIFVGGESRCISLHLFHEVLAHGSAKR